MTVRIPGTNPWADGDILYAADLNGTLYTQRKVISDATEFTTASATFVDKVTGTISAQSGALITGIHIKADTKISAAPHYVLFILQIDGTNLGTYYLCSNSYSYTDGTGSWSLLPALLKSTDTINGGAGIGNFLSTTTSTNYATVGASVSPGLKILDATTNIRVQLRTSNAAGTAYIKNVQVIIDYVPAYNEA